MREQKNQLASTAERLREVKQASLNFLELWALEVMARDADVMAKMARDVERNVEAAIANPHNHDWLLLYRGSVLDD